MRYFTYILTEFSTYYIVAKYWKEKLAITTHFFIISLVLFFQTR